MRARLSDSINVIFLLQLSNTCMFVKPIVWKTLPIPQSLMTIV